MCNAPSDQKETIKCRHFSKSLKAGLPSSSRTKSWAVRSQESPRTIRTSCRRMSVIDRQRGCLIGLAVGDALGAAVEFRSPSSFPPVSGYRDGGPHHLEAGEWTDDTSMALALADRITQAGWDLNDQAKRYVEWWQKGTYSVVGRYLLDVEA